MKKLITTGKVLFFRLIEVQKQRSNFKKRYELSPSPKRINLLKILVWYEFLQHSFLNENIFPEKCAFVKKYLMNFGKYSCVSKVTFNKYI